jgi:type IV pilus assembly protein PilB
VSGARWLTLDEAAARLGLSPPDVLAMVRSGRLSGVQVDGIWRIPLAEVEALMHRVAAEPTAARGVSDTLTRLGYISDSKITNFLSVQYGIPAVNLEEYEIDGEVLKLVGKDVCEKHKIIPVSRAGQSLIMAMADPTDLHAIDDIKFLTGFNVEPVVASEAAVLAAIERYYGSGTG